MSAVVFARVITREHIQQLPDNGSHSCTLFQHHQQQPNWGQACHLTLIGPSQIVLPEDSCFQQIRTTNTQFQINCAGQRISAQLNQVPSSRTFGALRLIDLPIQLEVEPATLVQTREQRQDLIDRQACRLISPLTLNGVLNGSNPGDIEIHSSSNQSFQITHRRGRPLSPESHGSQIECLNQENQPVIMGIVLYPNQIQWLDEYPELHEQRITTSPVVREQNDRTRLELSCRESGDCLENISPLAISLSESTQNLLDHLHFEYGKLIETTITSQSFQEDQFQLEQELIRLNRDYREILLACQQISISQLHRNDGQLESGVGANLLGFAQNLGLRASSIFSSDTLYNQFKDVDILKSNLTEEEMRAIIQQTQERNPDQSQLQLAVLTAGEMTRQVIRRFIRNMELAHNPQEEDLILNSVTNDFNHCLQQAVNAGQILTCADRVALRAPAELGKMELTQQLERNYLELYSVNGETDSQAFEDMKASAIAGYQACLLNYYYTEQIETDNVEKAKTCVFEAMLIGYREGSRYQIRATFAPLIDDPASLALEINNIRETSQQCRSGTLFHRAGSYQPHDYHALSQLDIDDFESRLTACSQELTHNAGDRAVRLTLRQDPALQRNLNERERMAFEDQVINEYYNGCMNLQLNYEERIPHPIHCENYIRQMVTLDVSKMLMDSTIREQMQSLESIPSQAVRQIQETLTQEVLGEIETCQTSINQQHIANLQIGQDGPGQSELISCLNQGIGLIAQRVAHLMLVESLQKSPDIAQYAQEILDLDEIRRLPDQTRQCFVSAIEQLEDIAQIDDELDSIVEGCTLIATREATMISAGIILERRLSDVISNQDERSRFIHNYLHGDNGLRQRVDNAQTAQEIEQLTNQISADVTLRFASQSVPQLVENYLSGVVAPSVLEETKTAIMDGLRTCLEDTDVDICVNKTTRDGYQLISRHLIQNSIDSAVDGDPRIATRLSQESDSRVHDCLQDLEPDQPQNEYNNQVTTCIAEEVLEVSKRIPSTLLLSLGPLMGSRLNSTTLQSRLNEADQIARDRGSFPPRYSADPATLHYMNLHQCLERTRENFLEAGNQENLGFTNLEATLRCQSRLNLRSGPSTEYLVTRGIPCSTSSRVTAITLLGAPRSGWVQIEYSGVTGYVSTNYLNLPQPRVIDPTLRPEDYPPIDLDQIMVASSSCTNRFEEGVRNQIRSNFISGSYIGRTRAHDRPLGIAGDILLMLQGRSDGSDTAQNSQETLNLMREVGQQVVNSCRFHEERCVSTLRQTQASIAQFKERNPNATSAQLQTRFMASPFMDLVIEATVADTFKRELIVALSSFQDNQGILQNRINYITSPAMMQRVFSGRYGTAARQYIRQRLESGSIDSLGDDQRLRSILASAVTEDLGNGSFVDELMYGIVQPKLNQERDTLRSGIGNLFGIVRRTDFDWHRVRQTAEGQEARRLFAHNLLEPMFQGADLGRMPSSQNRGKSVLDDNIARVEQLIEAGVRRLSR
jgi:hypothetical protein